MSTITVQEVLPLAYAALDKRYNGRKRGEECHVSDLAICPREASFRRMHPEPIGNMQLGYFTTGEGVHGIFQKLMCEAYPDRYEGYPYEKSVNFNGISGHIDLYDKIDRVPIELKTVNSGTVDYPKVHHLNQIKMYMAMLDVPVGKVIYQFFEWYKQAIKTGGPWREWTITMSDAERMALKLQMIKDSSGFMEALVLKDPSRARHIMNDPDLSVWKCKKYCSWYKQCKEINSIQEQVT